MRTPTENLHGHYCYDCYIDEDKIKGWYNEHGIIKINVRDYPRLGNGSLIV